MEFTIGAFYWRPCAKILTPEGIIYYIPVHSHLHSDNQFGFPDEHYHIDGRFYMESRMKHQFDCWDGYTSAVIVPNGTNIQSFMCLTETVIKCERLETDLKFPENPTSSQQAKLLDETWYKSYLISLR